ncbi:hypothetical protein C1Y09_27905, partial [Pseudomonas sp. FW306-02-F08-AA]
FDGSLSGLEPPELHAPACTNTRLAHGRAHARLDLAHAQRIIGITDDGDRGLIALAACQASVRGGSH